MKKILSLTLAFFLIISVVPLIVSAETIASGTAGCLIWTLTANGKLTVSGQGYMPEADGKEGSAEACGWRKYSDQIIAVVVEQGVVNIGSYSFSGCTGLTSIAISESVSDIGHGAFSGCASLREIVIPDSVTTIDSYAFENCIELTSITIPDTVLKMGCDVFVNTAYYNEENNWEGDVLYCNHYLLNAKDRISGEYCIKEGISLIADGAFFECTKLTEITIPESVVSIGQYAFAGCTELTDITVSDNVLSMDSDAFSYTAYYNDKRNWDNGVLYIGSVLVSAEGGISGSYCIKEGTSLIANWAFSECANLTDIVIPNSVKYIGACAFAFCTGLTSIEIPDGVTYIGGYAFEVCTKLTSITISDSVTWIDSSAFAHTAYFEDDSNWENDVLYIGSILLQAKKSVSGAYCIKEGTSVIANFAFVRCTEMTDIIFPDSVTTIGEYAFYHCTGLTSFFIPDCVTSIGRGAFDSCGELMICGARNSYAETFAMENGLSFKFDAPVPSNSNFSTWEIVLFIVAAITAAAVVIIVILAKSKNSRYDVFEKTRND